MGRFTSRAFRKHISKKSRKTRRLRRARKTRRRHQTGGGDTFSRRIPPQAVKANPLVWDDEPVA
uniref:Uncharacterized protein n=1 Tax=viral metagenome TaxID=1070528 RepID=A0A6C0KLD7_9ZZZZ